ncbi:adenylyl-sulfate kinase [Hippea alviniae]|uniref:adenylyl-sulfate kinase n=1 Tax=Hippea alviniae TaxID=1279027 RepID=UPI0003B3204E|nr:adenylyl-sulfate kinase [Hippea alviniae]
MFIETKTRSLLKAVSWRVFATSITILIVFIFFGKLELAIAAGILESISKIIMYFVHERIWNKINFGRKRVEPFVLWFTGLPLSGKTTIANAVYEKLKGIKNLPIQRIDSKDIREMIPEIGYDREDRVRHLKRVGFLIKVLQSNSISVVASFVSPYKDIREFLRKNTKNFIEIYVKASIDECKRRDYKGVYKKAEIGEIKNLTGIHEPYEEPDSAEIVLDTEKYSIEEMTEIVYKYVMKNIVKL